MPTTDVIHLGHLRIDPGLLGDNAAAWMSASGLLVAQAMAPGAVLETAQIAKLNFLLNSASLSLCLNFVFMNLGVGVIEILGFSGQL